MPCDRTSPRQSARGLRSFYKVSPEVIFLQPLGSVLGLLRLDVVDDGLNHEAATLGKELLKGGLEVESRTGSDRRREEAGDEGEHLLAEGQAGVAGLLERGLKLWTTALATARPKTLVHDKRNRATMGR